MLLSVGDKLGPYEILASIGAGGMGEVYKARDTRLDRIVAIKRLKGRHSGRFEQEARAIAALNHPHICQIYDIGTDYLVMEYVEGKPVRGPLGVEEAVRLALQIAAALEEAHGRGILHRDLKPDNILVTVNGSGKLIDFGLAKLTADSETEMTQTMEGTILGTAPYMAPEQAEGKPLDERSDVFSFGAVLYEMLSGRRAFPGKSTATVLSAILRDDPAPLEAPAELQRIVARCLAKQPRDRFPGMTEIRVALEQISNPRAEKQPSIAVLPLAGANRMTVGRDVQRGQMWRAYTRVKEGRGLILAVTGEAGIGKTSLMEEFLAELAERGERPVLGRGRCSERLAGDEAYLPILEALESLLHRHSGPSLSEVMKAVAPTWYGLVAGDSAPSSSAAPREAGPAASQERMKRELGALFQELSRMQPLVLFIDDLHWADISTIDILNYLAGRFADMRVLVLGSYRPSDMALARHPFLAIRSDLQSRGLFEEIGLRFLEPKDVERYLALQFPGHEFPIDFASVIHAKTEGSPLFMADLVRYLRDTGGIVEKNGRWALARSLPEVPRDLPESVRGMIHRKIEQVDERDRKLLVAASVQGHEFDSAVVAEAVEMDAADAEDRLETLEQVHVFVRRGEEREFPDRSLTLNYQFVHVLYQNALHISLQPTRRAALSGRVARALVARHGDQVAAVAARVAVLFEAARDFSASAQYFYIAARRSAGLFAFREALSLAERGLNAVQALPDDPARKQQELRLQMMKGAALRSTTGWATPEIERVFTRAWQLCQELDDPPELIPVLWSTTQFLLIRGNLRECRDRGDELMGQAERSGKQAYIMAALHVSGVVREFIGDMVESSRRLERCRELHVPSEHLAYAAMYGRDPGMTGRAMSSRPLWILGYPDRAVARVSETLTIARSQRQPTMVAFALVINQGIHIYRGEAAEALAMGEEIIALSREYELPQEALWSQAYRGYALHLLGRTSEGIDVLKASLAAQQAISAGLVRPEFLALLADALRQAGRVDEGLQAVDEGFAHAERTFEAGYLAELHRVRGELLRLTGNAALAEASLREALNYAGRQQAKSFELRAAAALARLLHSEGRRDDARAVLAPIYDWFTEGHDTADLVDARTLLSEIG
jgi:predicted ATPase/predicted Ser/Thr protein kinase